MCACAASRWRGITVVATARGVRHQCVKEGQGPQDRISLRNTEIFDGVPLLLHHLHQPIKKPYCASHALCARDPEVLEDLNRRQLNEPE